MKPTEILLQEHRVIEVALSCLERLTDLALENGSLDTDPAENALEFIRGFADQCHHHKEEDRLFTAMVDKGLPRDGGPIAVMLAEHEQGRAFVRGMAENIEGAGNGDDASLRAFAENARGYVELLRGHIQKEDNILFPMANNLFSDDEQKALLAEFKSVEAELMKGKDTERFFRIIQSLAEKMGVSTDPIARATGACGRFLAE